MAERVLMRKGKRRLKVTRPASGHEQVARDLRRRIIAGEFDEGRRLPSGPELAREYEVSLSPVQVAVKDLAREGLVAAASRQRTDVLPRQLWLFEVTPASAEAAASLLRAVSGHPAIDIEGRGPGVVRLAVVSANWGGAAWALASVAGALPVKLVTVREA